MDPLSGVASVIAVIQIAEIVFGLLKDYISAAKDAQKDIERLSVEEPGSAKLRTLNLLNEPEWPIKKCLGELKELATKLNPGQGDTAMKRVGWRALKWPFSSKDVDKKILIMERYKAAFNLALNTDNTTLILAMAMDMRHIGEGVTNIDEGVTRIDQGINELRQAAAEVRTDAVTAKELETRSRIIGWLANTDPLSNHYAACKKHQAGTGNWFIEGSSMERLKRQNSLLWLYGIPGCGKTILSSTIIEKKNESCILSPSHAVAYYYFSFNDSEKQSAMNFVSPIVAQLCSKVVHLPEDLKRLYSRCNDGKRQAAMPDLKALLKLFAMTKELQHVFMVIDALDECPRDGDREEILELIAEMKSWSPSNLHLLITSRQETNIEERLGPLLTTPAISIRGSQVASDIELYVNDQIASVTKWKKLREDLRLEIKEALVEGANGMFRWVFCQLEALKKCPPPQDPIRKALKNLPATLDETYEGILGNIDDEDSQQIARRSLLWLAFSERSLYLEELAEAAVAGSLVTLSMERVPFEPNQDDSDVIPVIEWSDRSDNSSLSDEGKPNEVIRLAHFSVKDYLVSNRIRSSKASLFGVADVDAHRFITEICLQYIFHYDQSGYKTISPKDLKVFPILQYACEFWYKHRNLTPVESRKALDPMVVKLFLSNTALLSCIRVHDPHNPWISPFKVLSSTLPLFYASSMGLEEVVRILIEAKADIEAKDDDGWTSLRLAADRGQNAVVQLLLEAKADTEAKDDNGWTALISASSRGHEAVVQLLIEAKADIEAKNDNGWTALMLAADRGHEAVVQLLIKAEANIETKNIRGFTALMLAVDEGHEAVVRLLAEAAANS